MTDQAKHWCFTLNNPTAEEVPQELLKPYAYLVYQKEEGANKTEHYQGFVAFATNRRLNALKKTMARAHWEPAKGTPQQNKVYCTKEEGRLDAPFEDGECPAGKGSRTDLKRVHDLVCEGAPLAKIAREEPATFMKYPSGIKSLHALLNPAKARDVKAFYVYGPTGIGKTHSVYTQFGLDNVYKVPHGKTLWFDGYSGQKVLLLDEFTADEWSPQGLLQVLDKWPYQCPVKGGFVAACWDTVVLLSNYPPPDWPEEMLRRFNAARAPPSMLGLAWNYSPSPMPARPLVFARFDPSEPHRIIHAQTRNDVPRWV